MLVLQRIEICERLGIEYRTAESDAEIETRDDAKLWIIKNQLGRRNLPGIDGVRLTETKLEIEQKRAGERRKATLKQGDKTPVPKNFTERGTGESKDKVAKSVFEACLTIPMCREPPVAKNLWEKYRAEAKERQLAGKKTDLVENLPQGSVGKARDKIGQTFGVSGKPREMPYTVSGRLSGRPSEDRSTDATYGGRITRKQLTG